MSYCEGGICANSTLSYMGVYLNKNKNKNKNTIFLPWPHVNFMYGYNEQNILISDYPEWATVYNVYSNVFVEN